MKKWTTALFAACLMAASTPVFAQDAMALAQQGADLHSKGDYAGALKLLTQAADQGNTYAMDQLGYMYLNGEGVTQNLTTSFSWFKKAADGGRAMDKHIVGIMYIAGIGVTKDEETGKNWIRQAAADGYPPAVEWRAENDGHVKTAEEWFTEGMNDHLAQNFTKAFASISKAAEMGNELAMLMVGNMYVSGQGVEKSFVNAYPWYLKAANTGNAEGQYFVGLMLFNGAGIDKDEAKGRQWIAKAAAQNQPNALDWQAQNGK